MPDPTPPAPISPKPRRPRSALNSQQSNALDKAEQIALAAQKAEFTAAMTAREITPAFLTSLLDDIEIARQTAASAVTGTTAKTDATQDEEVLMRALVGSIREIQKAARQKYKASDKVQLNNYYIGERLDQRPRLEQIATGIHGRLKGPTPVDTLPGITTAKVTTLKSALDAYKAINLTQTGFQGDATGSRNTLSNQVNSIDDRRRQIQFGPTPIPPTPANAANSRSYRTGPLSGNNQEPQKYRKLTRRECCLSVCFAWPSSIPNRYELSARFLRCS